MQTVSYSLVLSYKMLLCYVDEWRSHEGTAELLSFLSIGVKETEPRESESDGGSESSDSEDQSNGDEDEDGDAESNDYEDDEVSFTALSSRNPFELLADDS